MSVRIVTNSHIRDIVDAGSLPHAARADFDYLDWDGIDAGTDSASFFRYRGDWHDMGEFSADYGITRGAGLPFPGWDGYRSDSAFSALVVRIVPIPDSYGDHGVIVGYAYS